MQCLAADQLPRDGETAQGRMPMMPLLMGLDTIWWQLQSLEREHRTAAWRPATRGYDDHDDREARTGRVQRVHQALFFSGGEACHMLASRLSGIDLSIVVEVLLNACKDVAVYWGGSVLAGGALGGTFGAFAGGVGAIPGAAIGAGLGAQIGAWVLGVLGLKALIEDLGTAVPDALRHYEAGFRMAWGPVRRWEDADSVGMDWASREFALGHVLLMLAMLSAMMAYLTRGRGDPAAKARILQEIRESPRLGHKVADWVEANEEALARHPGLKPTEQQVVMSSQAKPPAGPPMTPSQLRALAGQSGSNMPPPLATSAKPAPPQPTVSAPAVRLTAADFPSVGDKVSQKQLRHIHGRSEYRGGGYLDNVQDAQAVLDAYRSGSATVIGKSQQGFPVVRFDGVTGSNVNVRAGFSQQPTNVFMIKGTASPSVVPMNPNWTP